MYIVKTKKLSDKAILPDQSYEGDAGFDLFSVDDYSMNPGERCLVHTGISIELPHNTEAQIRPRSGLAIKYGITVLNSPGTIDQEYRGELCVILINLGKETFQINSGTRIAQLVVKPIFKVSFVEVQGLSDTLRNDNGFGSTGIERIKDEQ